MTPEQKEAIRKREAEIKRIKRRTDAAWLAAYLDAIQAIPKIARAEFGDAHDLIQRKPIKAVAWKQRMDLMIYYADETHPDSDNVFKGIADALFMNDKHVVGSFDYEHDREGGGRVEVTIHL